MYFDHAKNLLDFGKYLKRTFDYYSGKNKDKSDLSISQLANLLSISLPIAAANQGTLVVEAGEGDKKLRASYKPRSCQFISARINNEIASRRLVPETSPSRRHLFYWYRATNDTKAKTGDRGKIDSISLKSVKTIIPDETIKARMLEGPIFERSYLVEVRIQTKMSVPTIYEIVNLIEIVEDD